MHRTRVSERTPDPNEVTEEISKEDQDVDNSGRDGNAFNTSLEIEQNLRAVLATFNSPERSEPRQGTRMVSQSV